MHACVWMIILFSIIYQLSTIFIIAACFFLENHLSKDDFCEASDRTNLEELAMIRYI